MPPRDAGGPGGGAGADFTSPTSTSPSETLRKRFRRPDCRLDRHRRYARPSSCCCLGGLGRRAHRAAANSAVVLRATSRRKSSCGRTRPQLKHRTGYTARLASQMPTTALRLMVVVAMARMCGCVDVWMCGCVDVWICGCVDVWMCGCVDVWMCGCVQKQISHYCGHCPRRFTLEAHANSSHRCR